MHRLTLTMAGSCCLLEACRLTAPHPTGARYNIYDGDAATPCRYHLLSRVEPLEANASAAHPGDAGRWSLQQDGSGLRGMGEMLRSVDAMYRTYMLYNLLQVRARLAAR